MGAMCSSSTPEDAASKKLGQLLASSGKEYKEKIKILLLGPGESGKSTVFKQMKIIASEDGYSQAELESFRPIVYQNCITEMQILCKSSTRLAIELERPENKARAARVMALDPHGETFNAAAAADIYALWQDRGIRSVYDLRDREFFLNESAAYFFDEVTRIGEPGYIPTTQDALRARVRSTGIEEANFEFDTLKFKMLDVGGQRSERRKWIHCFDSVTAVLFCVGISEYDQMLREDPTQNRMKESLLLFDEVTNSPWFRDTAFILFLNKKDLFEEKIKHVDLSICFPSYKGGKSYEEGTKYIQEKFLSQNQSPHRIYCHLTCAIDTKNITLIFGGVKEALLRDVLMW